MVRIAAVNQQGSACPAGPPRRRAASLQLGFWLNGLCMKLLCKVGGPPPLPTSDEKHGREGTRALSTCGLCGWTVGVHRTCLMTSGACEARILTADLPAAQGQTQSGDLQPPALEPQPFWPAKKAQRSQGKRCRALSRSPMAKAREERCST